MPTTSAIIANDILKSLESIHRTIKTLKGLDFYSPVQGTITAKLKKELSGLWSSIQNYYSDDEQDAATAFTLTSSFPGLSSSTTLENILSYIFMLIMDLESSVIYGMFFEDDNYATYAWQLVYANKSKVNSLIVK